MMGLDRLKSLIDAYGADPKRWPADERAAGLLLLTKSAEAHAYARQAEALDKLLDQAPLRPTVTVDPVALATEIARRPARPARVGVRRSFADRLGLGFGWANIAALAAAGVVGFMVGWTDLNTASNVTAAGSRDIVDLVAPVTSISTTDESVW